MLREIELLKTLNNYKHVVQYICHISCNDYIKQWYKEIIKPITPCQVDNGDSLTFIVMEYIKDGDLIDFFNKSPTLQQLESLFFQTAYIFMEIGFTYNIYHGDVNSGNILLKKTSQKNSFN